MRLQSTKWALSLAGVLIALGGATGLPAQQPGGDTEKAVLALENQWLQANKANNPDLAAPLIADKYVNTGADGKLEDKAQTLALAKARKYATAENEEFSNEAQSW